MLGQDQIYLFLLGEGSSKEGLRKVLILDETFLILRSTTISHNLLSFLCGKDFTKRLEYVGELSSHQRTVVRFIINLKTLNEIVKGSHVLLLLELAVDGKNFLNGQLLLTTVLGSTGLLNHGLSDAEIKGPHEGSKILGVDLSLGEGVIDLKMELAKLNFIGLKIGHCTGV